MRITPTIFEEPLLEFGEGGRHVDPRQGLREHGPLQGTSGETLRIGVVGSSQTA